MLLAYPVGSRGGGSQAWAVEQAAEGVEFADAPFSGGGQVGLDEGELGAAGEYSPVL